MLYCWNIIKLLPMAKRRKIVVAENFHVVINVIIVLGNLQHCNNFT